MEFKDQQCKLNIIFDSEWAKGNLSWKDFIQSKDLGIVLQPMNVKSYFAVNVVTSTLIYGITDHKKWTFTKLKYGI